MDIYNLIIEVTRRCNMKCIHCLRGNTQRMDLDTNMLDVFLKNNKVSSIFDVTFTGGEPSLVPEIIDQCLGIFEKNRIYIERFYLATNAVKVSNEFIHTLFRMWTIAKGENGEYLKKVTCHISNDQYHRQDLSYNDKNIERLMAFSGTSFKFPDKRISSVIFEGRAFHWGDRKNLKSEIELDPEIDFIDSGYIGGDLYLNCKGNIINGCDWSYASQNRKSNIVCRYDESVVEKIKARQKIEKRLTA